MLVLRKHLGALATLAFVAGFALVATNAVATPAITSAVIKTRVFNDDPTSVLTTGNTYANPPNAGSIFIEDASLDNGGGGGFANRHAWRFSANGVDDAVFLNGDGFAAHADVTVTGTAATEAGLQISPWWSQDVDGVFAALPSGEIAAFGGRLPFYSFNAQSVVYTKGTTVGLDMIYSPNGLSMASPATVEYIVTQGANVFTSGPLAFDEGNPAEDPPYGLWGMLNDARVGGYMMAQINSSDPNNLGRADFDNISFVPEPATMALLALGGLALLRRRS